MATSKSKPVKSNTTKANAKPNKKADNKDSSGVPKIKYPGDVTATTVDPTLMEDVAFDFTDPTFNIDKVTPDTVSGKSITAGKVTAGTLADRFMTAAEYQMIDPADVAKEFGDINRGQARSNADLANELSLKQLETELQGLQNYVPVSSELKRSQVAKDNAFNQAQRDAQLAAADPNMRADLEAQRARSLALASGKLPSSIEDRALELGVRSRAADMSGASGFGARSSAARKASELMSVERRLQLSEYGDKLLTSNIATRNEMLLSPTAYSDAGAQVQVMPTQSASALAQANLADLNSKTMMTPAEAARAKIDQNQFKSKLDQEASITNVNLAAERDAEQARLNLTADTTNLDADMRAQEFTATSAQQAETTNAANRLNADLSYQDARLRGDMTAAQIRSSETQAASQLSWNTANANAQRSQEVGMFNSENKLRADSSNRDTKLDVDKFNKNLVFQDQQQRRAEAAANARAAAAERGASARAAMSAALQREQMAINIAEKEKDRQFALSQQAAADKMYREGLSKGQSNANAAAIGNGLGRVGTVVNGVGTTITAISNGVTAISNLVNGTSTTPTTTTTTTTPPLERINVSSNIDGSTGTGIVSTGS